jgi:hypothetical protein
VSVIERKRGRSFGHFSGERFYILDLLVETQEFQFSGERFSGKEKLLTHRRTKVFGATWGELLFSNILANSLFFWDTACRRRYLAGKFLGYSCRSGAFVITFLTHFVSCLRITI